MFPFIFENDVVIEPFYVKGYVSINYQLPFVKNSVGKALPLYIDLPERVIEFATYDQKFQTIFVKDNLLQENHEGIYDIVVQIGYGSFKFEKRHNVTM